MQGKIIKGIAGFYYVQTEDKLYECKAKGIFRNKKMKPLVGDNVEIDILDEEDQEGKYQGNPYEKERTDPSGGGEYRPGVDYLCGSKTAAKLQSVRSFSDDDGETGSTCDRLLQQSGSCKRTRSDIVRKSI